MANSTSGAKAPAVKLAQVVLAPQIVTLPHFWQVWLTGDNEQDSFIVNASVVADVTQLAINEYYRRNGVGPVNLDKIVQKS
jgi:hypothetical protein